VLKDERRHNRHREGLCSEAIQKQKLLFWIASLRSQ